MKHASRKAVAEFCCRRARDGAGAALWASDRAAEALEESDHPRSLCGVGQAPSAGTEIVGYVLEVAGSGDHRGHGESVTIWYVASRSPKCGALISRARARPISTPADAPPRSMAIFSLRPLMFFFAADALPIRPEIMRPLDIGIEMLQGDGCLGVCAPAAT